MKIIQTPQSIDYFHKMWGVVEFTFFNEVLNTTCTQKDAITAHLQKCLRQGHTIHQNYFESHFPIKKSRDSFLGTYYDFGTKKLGWPEGAQLPEWPMNFSNGDDNGLSHFLAMPCYGPVRYGTTDQSPGPGEWEAAIEAVIEELLPLDRTTEIYDWCHPELEQLSNYFSGGMEWGYANLFLLNTPADRRVVVISESIWP
jgi:hypothetical protein